MSDLKIDMSALGSALFLTEAGASALLAVVLLGLHRLYQRAFLLHWGAAWLALACAFVGKSVALSLPHLPRTHPGPLLATALELTAGYAYVAGLVSGTWMLATGRGIARGARALLFALPVMLGTGIVLGTLELRPHAQVIARWALLAVVSGLALLGAAYGVSRLARRDPSLSRWVVVALLFGTALTELAQFADLLESPLHQRGVDSIFAAIAPRLLSLFLQLVLLSGLLLWFFEDERRTLARTARALRESEEQRRRAEHMEAVGRLAGGVAHDFNNLLTAITGHAELLLLRTGAGHPDREDLLPIAHAAARAAERVRELLTFSRRQPRNPRNFVPDALLSELRKMLERLVGDDVRLELALGAPSTVVHADPAQIELAVLNLVTNARDAMDGSGVLRVRTALVAGEAGAGASLLIEVADDGCGIAPEAQAKIFEPFFTTKPGKGTGLGLASVYGIVTQSGGDIRVESALGAGTTFRIRLPVVDAAPDRPVELVPAAPGRGGDESVLLVEDEAQVRVLAQRLLTRAGYRVTVAGGGEEALERLRATPDAFQLLLSDVVMPGMPLQQLVESVRRDHPSLRVLLMSGYSGSSIGQQGVDVPMAAFLQKPFTSRELLDAVRAALDAPPQRARTRGGAEAASR